MREKDKKQDVENKLKRMVDKRDPTGEFAYRPTDINVMKSDTTPKDTQKPTAQPKDAPKSDKEENTKDE